MRRAIRAHGGDRAGDGAGGSWATFGNHRHSRLRSAILPGAVSIERHKMVDRTPEQQKALDATIGSLNRIAMKIVGMPKSDREAHYALVRKSMIESFQVFKMDAKTGEEWLEKYMGFLRALVEMIEAGGGADGGRA